MDHCDKLKRKANPREEANIISLFTFGYTLGLFKKGFKKDLEEKDLYEVIKKCRSNKCGNRTEKEWIKSQSMCRLLWRRFGFQYIVICLITIVWTEVNSVLRPYGMSRLISYFEENQTKISRTEAYYCAGLVVFLKIFQFLFLQNLSVYEAIFAMQISTSLKSLLYRKALKLSPTSLSETNLGNLVTIITKDIHNIETHMWIVKDILIFVIQTLTVSYLLWAKMGNCSFIGVGMMLLALPAQMYLSTLVTKMRLKVGQNSDNRLQVTQETLSAISIIKMYTWENFFQAKINKSRKKEVGSLVKASYIVCFVAAIGMITSKLTFLVLILSYIGMGYTTNTEMIFYVLSLFHELSIALALMVPISLTRAASFYASFIRLNKILQAAELKKIEEIYKGVPLVEVKNASVKIKDEVILKGVTCFANSPGLTLITGPVGSGKSSLLKVILHDYPIYEGFLEVQGTVSYASQDPWLFPSSIKQNILFGEKYDKTRYEEVIRVCALEYDLSFLDNGDETIVADRGQNLSKGQQSRINLARAVYRTSDIYLLDDSLTALDGHVQEFIFRECVQKFLRNKIRFLVSQNPRHIDNADKVVILDQGKTVFTGNTEEIKKPEINGLTVLKNIKNALLDDEFKKTDKKTIISETEQQTTKKKVYQETKKAGKVDFVVYKKYFQFGGGLLLFLLIISIFVAAQVSDSVSEKMLSKWIDLQQKVIDMKDNATINATFYEGTSSKKDFTFTLYAVLTVLKTCLGFFKYYSLLWYCKIASINIHKAMSSRVINAGMSFFDTHYLGNILNRFSYDLSGLDENLPFLFPGLFSVIFGCVGSIVLISTVNWLFLIPACLFCILLLLIRMVYIPTGRSLKRLEASTRSPLVGHINSSLEGLTTIRAFQAETILRDEFDRYQDLYTSAFFTLKITTTSFGFFMDLLSTIFTIAVIARFLFFEHDISAGNVGLALTQVFLLTNLVQWGVREWANLENQMTSAERVLEYTDIKQENKLGGEVNNWPSDGCLKYEKVSLCYESAKEPVLKNVDFTVNPRQKIGIVGRTGAGKSSIISTLFRLYDYEGVIEIDGVDIKSLSLSLLRKSIAIIPQDPILFSGTVRDNIDPYKKYTDNEIWQAIEKVKIKDIIPTLDTNIEDGGSNFSAGQKQLICMARAATGTYKIVVLDEATANMDAVTDKMLHDVIDELFSDCTILTIAHRLHTIMNCDMVIVMDNGELVEFDNPKILRENQSSLFYKMCEESKMD